tara:strand:+ start:2721 stop:3293 length:573 start_codon:yes stop_codon:yes gene_type:complete
VKLIVGLGNPGNSHDKDRHNVGFWFLDRLCLERNVELKESGKFKAYVGSDSSGVWYMKPLTYMNLSGLSVRGLSEYYKIPPGLILVVHDELDLPSGIVKLKRGGGTGGHNGLRSIEESIASRDYCRLRLGIGRPNERQTVTSYVLSAPTERERHVLEARIDKVLGYADDLIKDFDKSMNIINQSSHLEKS